MIHGRNVLPKCSLQCESPCCCLSGGVGVDVECGGGGEWETGPVADSIDNKI